MTIREVDFNVSFETSSAPTTSDPSADTDSMTKGYADSNYTPRSNIYGKVSDITALKAIGTTSRFNEQVCYVAGVDLFYEFSSASSATADDDLVVQPTSGTGRWLKIAQGGSAGDGTASALDELIQKVDNEKAGVITTPIDNSCIRSGSIAPFDQVVEGNLMADFTSGGSTLHVVWNGQAVNSSDKNFDATTNWSAVGAGASLTTSGTKKIGTASLQFDKNGTATEAGIRYDQSTQSFNTSVNYRVWFWINLPSITNLSNVYIKMYADTTSNYRKYVATTNSAGGALATGWNLIFIDLSDTTGSSTGGTGWTYTTLSRYQELGVTTSSAGQTYTAVLLDALYFSLGAIAKFGSIANEFSIFDNSINSNVVIDSANTKHDGALTLSAALTGNVSGGTSGSSRGRIVRSNMQITAPASIPMNNDSGFSGTVTTTQYLRLQTMLRESLSGSYQGFVDLNATQIYTVTSVGGSTIDVSDSSDTHLNLLNGDTMDIFRPQYIAGEVTYTLLASRALTANSSYSGGTTTLTLTTTSIAAGDLVVKRQLTEVSLSSVSSTANENFSALSLDADPNGKILLGNFTYPQESSVYAHYTLADYVAADAVRNRKGTNTNFTLTGSLSTVPFKQGRLAASGFGSSNYYGINSTTYAQPISGDSADCTSVIVSFWFYDSTGFTGSDRYIIGVRDSGGGNGWKIGFDGTANYFKIRHDEINLFSGASYPYTANQWNHVVYVVHDSSASKLWLNGVQIGSGTQAISATTYQYITAGKSYAGSSDQATGMYMADLIIWRNATDFTSQEVNYLYNAGAYLNTMSPNQVRYIYTANGQSGQKVSLRAKMQRSTTAITPNISGIGFIKK